MPTPPLTDQELLDYSREHLGHEIEMFRSTASGLTQHGLLTRLGTNALLESWVIHLRNLIEFLFQDAPRRDDVTAADFFPNPAAWQGHRTPLSAMLDAARARASKEIGHLTTQRIAGVPDH